MIARKLQEPNTPVSPKHIIALGLYFVLLLIQEIVSSLQVMLFRYLCGKTQFCHVWFVCHIATCPPLAACPCDLQLIQVNSANIQSINCQMSYLSWLLHESLFCLIYWFHSPGPTASRTVICGK